MLKGSQNGSQYRLKLVPRAHQKMMSSNVSKKLLFFRFGGLLGEALGSTFGSKIDPKSVKSRPGCPSVPPWCSRGRPERPKSSKMVPWASRNHQKHVTNRWEIFKISIVHFECPCALCLTNPSTSKPPGHASGTQKLWTFTPSHPSKHISGDQQKMPHSSQTLPAAHGPPRW